MRRVPKKAQGVPNKVSTAALTEEFQIERKRLKRTINDNKKKFWNKLIEEVYSDSWRRATKFLPAI